MRYVGMFHPAPSNMVRPSEERMAAMGELIQTMKSKGALLVTEPLGSPGTGARIELADGQYQVVELTDRPGGYAILQADTREACIEQIKEFLAVAGDGVCEIRQIVEM